MEYHDRPKIQKSEELRAKIVMDMILEFLHRIPDEAFQGEKANFSTRDYSLEQFQKRVGSKIKYSASSKNRLERNAKRKWRQDHD